MSKKEFDEKIWKYRYITGCELGNNSMKSSSEVIQMRLTPRLQAIADKIPPGLIVADIGTDHAYIPVYLLKNHLTSHVIASDSKKGPLNAAAETLELFNMAKAADLRHGYGLSVLSDADQVNVAVISGMGGETICSILDNDPHVLRQISLLVLQPMTDVGLVRSWLARSNFGIIQEDIVQEDKSFYEIIVAEQNAKGYDYDDYRILDVGQLLISDKHPLLKPMLQQRLIKTRRAMAGAGKSGSNAAKARAADLETKAEFLEA